MTGIIKLCKLGEIHEAFRLIDSGLPKGKFISRDDALHLIQACTKRKDLAIARRMHALMIKSNLESVPILIDHLIRLFSECGSMHEANLAFGKVREPGLHTWSAILSAYAALGEHEGIFLMFEKMMNEGVRPDKFIFMSILKSCCTNKDLARGESIHRKMIENNIILDVIMGSTLLDMYAKCGNLEMACQVFDKMPSRDIVTWNSMIGAYVHHGNGIAAVKLYRKMQAEGIHSDRVTFLSALKACGITKSLDEGMLVHNEISNSGLTTDVVIGSAVIDMYAKCGEMEKAHEVFDDMPNRNVVSWGAMIAGYIQNGRGHMALTLFKKMQEEGVEPDRVILACLLKACGDIHALGDGSILHEQVIKNGLESDVVVGNNLFYMYAKSGSMTEARKVFDSLPNRDVISWTTMIAGYAQDGQGLPALELFKEMQGQGISPDEVIYSCVLKACSMVGAFGQGKLIHDKCSRESESDVILGNTLIDMYAKCGNIEAAHKLFDALPNRNVVSWNSIITAYVHMGEGLPVFTLFKEMQEEGIKPTKVTFLCILKACSIVRDLDFAESLHGQLIDNDIGMDVSIKNALVDTYAKCGRLDLALEVFNKPPNPDAVSWGAMIGGYVHNGQNHAALELFKRMEQEGIDPDNVTIASLLKACSNVGALEQGRLIHHLAIKCRISKDVLVGNALIDMYSKCGSIERARKIFNAMPKRDVVSWNTMITGYTLHGHASPALELFEDMQRYGFKPGEVTFLCALKACSLITCIEQGRHIHDQIIKSKHGLTFPIGNSLIDMYAKCGNLKEARCVFDNFHSRNVITWGVIIGSYSNRGMFDMAKQCMQEMKRQGMKPDAPIHLSFLAACSHAGHAKEGYDHFKSMEQEYGMAPTVEHFNSLVDLLGRAGRLEDAEELLRAMPSLSTLPAWVSLLTACKAYGSKETGRRCFMEVSKLDPENASGYAILSDIFGDEAMMMQGRSGS